MTASIDTSVIYIISDDSPLCASVQAILETTDRAVEPICDANCFLTQVLEQDKLRANDLVLINLDRNPDSNFRLVSLMMDSEQGPAVLLLSARHGSFFTDDSFANARLEILHTPVHPQKILSTVEAIV